MDSASSWISLFAIAISSLFALLSKRESNRHEETLKAQSAQIDTLTAANARCVDEHKASVATALDYQIKNAVMSATLASMRTELDELKKNMT